MDDFAQTTAIDPDALEDARLRPWAHSFVTLLRTLGARDTEQPVIGKAQRPAQESFRLGQQASLAFAVREVAKVEPRHEHTLIKLLSLGMLGPNGVLPLHFTELVRERSEAKVDETLADFLDMFHHRWLTHMYRAWAQAQSAAGLDRSGLETFTPYVARLGGDEPKEVLGSALSPHARWASIAHRVRASRDPEGLVSTLSRYFDVPATLREYHLAWMPIEEQDKCLLGTPRLSSMVGQGAMLGELVPDRQSRFRLVLGPLDIDAYLRMTPQGASDGSNLQALIELVRAFIGFEYVWELELLILAHAAPDARLGDENQLGWSTWMCADTGHASGQAITGMILEPESYAKDKGMRPLCKGVDSTAASCTNTVSA